MFDPLQIPQLVAVLERRQASLWHGCQLTEFATYLRLGGVASPALVDQRGEEDADQPPDAPDRAHDSRTRDLVLLALEDLGDGFAGGRHLLPNPRGPIALQLHPRVLERAAAVEVTLRSLATPDFDARADSLTDATELDRCYVAPATVGFPMSTRVRFGERLAEEFIHPHATGVEVALTARRPIPFADVVVAWVDPVTHGRVQLIDRVEGLADAAGIPLRVRRRTMVEPSRADVWHDLVHLLADGEQPLLGVWQRADTSPAFRTWAAELRAAEQGAPFARFGRSLYAGTLVPLRESARPRVAAGERVRVAATAAIRPVFPPGPRPSSVHPCGHPREAWDHGTCYACVRGYRSAWRYDRP